MATEVFKSIVFALPSKGKLAAARAIGQACGAAWRREGVGELPHGYPEELDAWSKRCRWEWRSGLVDGWTRSSAESADRRKAE